MTKDELSKVPFRMSGHVSMAHEHTTTYVNQQYEFILIDRAKVIKDGMGFGKTKREYCYQGKVYKKYEQILDAIKDVEFKG